MQIFLQLLAETVILMINNGEKRGNGANFVLKNTFPRDFLIINITLIYCYIKLNYVD